MVRVSDGSCCLEVAVIVGGKGICGSKAGGADFPTWSSDI